MRTKGVSFIVFARNESEDFLLSLDSILKINSNLDFPIEIIAIDDGSTDDTKVQLEQYNSSGKNHLLKFFESQPPLGISAALASAIKKVSYEKCIPLPGHYMFDEHSLSILVGAAFDADVIIGYRENLFRERPLGKFLAAKILRILFYLFISKKIQDPHGLIVYPTKLLQEILITDMKHENHIRALAYAVGENASFSNVAVNIRRGHKERSSQRGRPSVPRVFHLITGLVELQKGRKILKNSSNLPTHLI